MYTRSEAMTRVVDNHRARGHSQRKPTALSVPSPPSPLADGFDIEFCGAEETSMVKSVIRTTRQCERVAIERERMADERELEANYVVGGRARWQRTDRSGRERARARREEADVRSEMAESERCGSAGQSFDSDPNEAVRSTVALPPLTGPRLWTSLRRLTFGFAGFSFLAPTQIRLCS